MKHIYYECMRCREIRCMACESPAPAGYKGEIKTAVKWCGKDECVADEALANGATVERMWRVKNRVQAAWRRDAKCLETR